MSLPTAVSDHYKAQQRLIVAALGLTRREWAKMGTDWQASWATIAPRVALITASAQLGAARNGAAYVPKVLEEYGEDVASLADVEPRAFAGVASDGRPLVSLLDGALYAAASTGSLDSGGKWLDMAVHTQIADAGRGAASVAIAARPSVGWVRMVNPPCCGPCAVLSGKEFRYNQGFKRHPRCDCVHIPTTLANPGNHFGVDPPLDQIKDLTVGERKALHAGSDLSRVINARRGGGLGKMTTTSLAKRGKSRLTPDGVFAQAKSRDEALELLRANGYLTQTARRVPVRAVPGEVTAQEAAESAVSAATAAEPALTKLTSGLAERFGGRMEGLDFRLKSVDSLTRKLEAEVLESFGAMSPSQAAAKMFDVNRYTTVYSEAGYAKSVQSSLDAMRADGYTLNVKNYWNVEDNPYQGVNVQIMSPAGEKFELQFHTDFSLEVKEGELHRIYEAQRIETDKVQWGEYQRQMFEVAGKIPVPPGIRDVS